VTATFHDKTALVIGGTRGIGAAITCRMAADGAAVAAIHLSRAQEADMLAAEVRELGGDLLTIQADIADPSPLSAAIDTVVARFGRIDILVNTAGLAITGPLEDYPADAFDRVFAVNVRAPFLAAQRVAATMLMAGGSSRSEVSSPAARRAAARPCTRRARQPWSA
jgi:3-oxoacyl-[acyl-carrier protein] reductase